MQLVFYGVGVVVIGIIVMSVYKFIIKSVGKDKLLWVVYLLLVVVIVLIEFEVVWLFLVVGVLVWFWCVLFKWLCQGCINVVVFVFVVVVSGLLSVVDLFLFVQFGVFFVKVGVFVFGLGLVIVLFFYGGVVMEYYWFNDK